MPVEKGDRLSKKRLGEGFGEKDTLPVPLTVVEPDTEEVCVFVALY